MHSVILFLLLGSLSLPNLFHNIRKMQKQIPSGDFTVHHNEAMGPWNWSLVGPEGGEIFYAISHLNAPDFAFALGTGDVWRTTDGGVNWELSFADCGPQSGVISSPSTGVIVDNNDEVWITLDAGVNWSSTLHINRFQTLSSDVTDTILYLVDSIPLRVWLSTNSGSSWQEMGTIDSLDIAHVIAHIPTAANVVYLAGYKQDNDTQAYILNSTDYGATWAFIDTIVADEIRDIEHNPFNPLRSFISTSTGIYQDTSGTGVGPWIRIVDPIVSGLFLPSDIEFTGDDTILVSSIVNPGIFRGILMPGFWTFTHVEDREVGGYMSFGNDTTLYCGSFGVGVFKSVDEGLSWSISNNNLYAHSASGGGAASQIYDSTFYFMAFGGSMFRTDDWGTTWIELPRNFLFWGTALEVAPTDPQFLIASAIDGEIVGVTPRILTIFRSTDGGTNWTEVDSTYSATDFLITSDPDVIIGIVDTVLIRSTAGGNDFTPILTKSQPFYELAGIDTTFVSTSDSTFVSYDRGATWLGLIDRGGALAYDDTRKVLYIGGDYLYRYNITTSTFDSLFYNHPTPTVSANGNLYFLFTSDTLRIARSFDGGNTVEEEILPIDVSLTGGLRAGDDGVFFYRPFRAFWVSNEITSGVEDITLSKPSDVVLFAPTIVRKGCDQEVHLTIDKEENISLLLHNVTGRRVREIFRGTIGPGKHRFNFSTINLSSGVYFITFSSKNKIAVVKQIIH